MDNDRRNSIRPLKQEELTYFLDGRTIASSTLFSSGKCNSNYKLILDDGSKFVARLSNSISSARELRVMDLARDLVPVPRVVYQRSGLTVLEFLEGQILEVVPEHSRLAGLAIAQFSILEFDSPGRIEEDGSIAAFDFGGVRGFIAQCLENPEVLSRLGPHRQSQLDTLLQARVDLLDELGSETHFVHGDFNPTNILIHEEKLSGVIDWEYALSGTPFMDIGNLLRNIDEAYHHEVENGLLEGGMKLPQDWKERAELVDLISQFEFLTSPRSEEFKLSCLRRIDRFVEKYGQGT